MNSTNIKNPFGLALSTLGLAVLTACGGGGEEPVQQATPAAVVTICGEPTTATSGPEFHKLSGVQTVDIDGSSTQYSLVTSPGGFPYDDQPIPLAIPLEDLRDVAQLGYTPQATLDSMGIEMGSRLTAGSVGCVRGVSRVKNNGTADSPSYQITWASEKLSSVPIDSVPGYAINGFEFLNNFDTTLATAVFRMDKALVTDESQVQVCHITSSAIDCLAPTVSEDGTQWVFKSPVAESGVYVLSASLRELPMD